MIVDLQKASVWKRISAGMFDGILLGTVAVLCAWLLSSVLGFDVHYDALTSAYDRYAEEYGVNLDMSLSEYESMTEEQTLALEAAYTALSNDEEAMYAYNMVMQLTIMIISLGIFGAYLIMEFVIPLILGNGQTFGKKIFGIALMDTEGVKLKTVALFIRTLLGKYAIETMIPVLILMMLYFGAIGLTGTIILLLILIAQPVLMLITDTNAMIHDLLAGTVCVTMNSQMIFDSHEEKLRYIEKQHAEAAARADY